jgi:hypothetical protein
VGNNLFYVPSLFSFTCILHGYETLSFTLRKEQDAKENICT